MADAEVDIVVEIGAQELLAGHLWSHRRGAKESATFIYDTQYLAHPTAYALDPALPLTAGQQQTPVGRKIFGAFSDCAPDRWGRRLIDREAKRLARRQGAAERSRGEIDYLVGVRDDLRQGALRFREPRTGTFLADEKTGVPHLLDLPRLLHAAERLERDEASEADLKTLLRGGSSLGGARPKAHVIDAAGRVAIAKFPSPNDDWDVIRWEAVALELARDARITVPDWTLESIDEKPVLILDRFDRDGGLRIGYVSTMTMLELADHEEGSYLDIADVIAGHSPAARVELQELWRRIAFSILIRNTDDHLRNHGFLRTSTAGWSLAPAFDLNPDPDPGPKFLRTLIDYDTSSARMEVLMAVAEEFRLSGTDAGAVVGEVVEATGHWRAVAERIGLSDDAIDDMAHAFEHEEVSVARDIARSVV